MTAQIPLKAVKSSGVAVALAEYAPGDYDDPSYLPPIFGDYIAGMAMAYVGPAAISVSGGACYVPSLGYVLAFPSAITKSGLSLSASTWYHVYGFLNGTTPDIEIATVAPSAPYLGRARTKAGDTSRRYIGSFRTSTTGATGAIMNFTHSPATGSIKYLSDINGNGLKVLDNGTSNASVTVSAAAVVPPTCFVMDAFAENAGTAIVFINSPDMGAASSSSILQFLRPSGLLFGEMLLNTSQQFGYALNTSSTNGLTVWCVGYKYAR